MLRIKVEGSPFLNEGFLDDATKELEDAFLEEMKDSWKEEEEPEKGRPWRDRKPPTGSWPLLKKTGKLQETAKIFFNKRKGFSARVEHYGVYQNRSRRMFAVNDPLIERFEEILCQKIMKSWK